MKLSIFLSILMVTFFVGCSQTSPLPKAPKTYSIATRQLPPEPAFASTRWVRPPEVAPLRNPASHAGTGQISPIFQYKVQNTPLKEAVLILAAPLRYQTYCSTAIADKKLSMDSLGTIDELAKEIEVLSDIAVVVDHQLKEVRFLSR